MIPATYLQIAECILRARQKLQPEIDLEWAAGWGLDAVARELARLFSRSDPEFKTETFLREVGIGHNLENLE